MTEAEIIAMLQQGGPTVAIGLALGRVTTNLANAAVQWHRDSLEGKAKLILAQADLLRAMKDSNQGERL